MKIANTMEARFEPRLLETGLTKYNAALHAVSLERQSVGQTYGELLPMSIPDFVQFANMTVDDVFVDLGSGLGRLLVATAITAPARELLGIELDYQWATTSQRALERLQQSGVFRGRHVSILCGDMLAEDWEEATVAYSCPTCFSDAIIEELCLQANESPRLRRFISTKPLPWLDWEYQGRIAVQFSWDSGFLYRYDRTLPSDSRSGLCHP